MARRHNRTARKVTLADGTVVHCIADDGRHYMDADHWPKDRDFDVFAIPLKRGMYELIVARQVIGHTVGLSDAALLANKVVTS